jgi:hypothetical protein
VATFAVHSRHLPGGTAENHAKPQSVHLSKAEPTWPVERDGGEWSPSRSGLFAPRSGPDVVARRSVHALLSTIEPRPSQFTALAYPVTKASYYNLHSAFFPFAFIKKNLIIFKRGIQRTLNIPRTYYPKG